MVATDGVGVGHRSEGASSLTPTRAPPLAGMPPPPPAPAVRPLGRQGAGRRLPGRQSGLPLASCATTTIGPCPRGVARPLHAGDGPAETLVVGARVTTSHGRRSPGSCHLLQPAPRLGHRLFVKREARVAAIVEPDFGFELNMDDTYHVFDEMPAGWLKWNLVVTMKNMAAA